MLRPYQETALNMIRAEFARGTKRLLLQMPTGSGKTVIFCEVLKGASSKGNPCVVVTRGRKIVDQASQRLVRETVEHGVLMANHWMYRPHLPVQVCSIDTIVARSLKPEAKLIIIDEAHLAISAGYKGFLKQYPDAYILAVTATPYGDVDMTHMAQKILKPVSMKELIADGYLVPGRYFCPFQPDLSAVKVSKSTNDYDTHELGAFMDTAPLVGDIVTHWQKFGENRPTLAFGVTVEHSKHIRDSFEEAGIPAAHLDASSPDRERERTISDLVAGRIKVISNVGILTTGVDIPEVSCGILARPTRSYNLYVQMIGRFTRPAPGKKDFILLDHGDCVGRHGFPEDEPIATIEGSAPKQKPDVRICKICYAVFRGRVCPHCGEQTEMDIAPPAREIIASPGELRERTNEEMEEIIKDIQERTRHRDQLVERAKFSGYKMGWVFFKLKEAYGESSAKALMQGFWK